MSKKHTSSQTLVLVSDNRSGRGLAHRRQGTKQVALSPTELAQFQRASKQTQRNERETSGGSTVFRCRYQLRPVWTAVAVYAAGGVGHLVVSLWPGLTGWAYGSVLAAGMTAAAVIGYRVASRWRVRALLAAAAATVWLMLALHAGITWTTSGALLGVTGLLAARWWQHHRPGFPTGPPAKSRDTSEAARPARDDIPGMFARYVAGKRGILEGSYLTNREESEHALKWTVELVPGQQSISTVRTQMENFLSGLRRPQEEIIVEPHPSRDSAQLLLSVVTSSPISDTVVFDGPRYFESEDGKHGWVEPAWYADGAGRVQVPVYAPNSCRHLTVIGGQGSGKSGLLNAMGVSLMASDHTTVWYLDGQDGGSSPQLMSYADWAPTGDDREKVMLQALKRLFTKRGRRMKRERRSGLKPTPEFPGLIVIIDECHKIWRPDSPYLKEWIELAREARKLCVGFWAATQHPSIESFGGSDTLRSLLMQYTTLVLRIKGNVSKNILSMAQDPSTLPTLPGYGYVLSGDGATREAPFRADFLDNDDPEDGTPIPADLWFDQYPCPPLHRTEQAVLGDAYRNRVALAAAMRADLDTEEADELATVDHGESIDMWDETDDETQPDTSPLGPPRFPRLTLVPTPRDPQPAEPDTNPTNPGNTGADVDVGSITVPDGVTGQAAAVYRAIANGAASRTDLQNATGLGKSRIYELLTALQNAGHVTRRAHGHYTTTADHGDPGHDHSDAATPPPDLAAAHRDVWTAVATGANTPTLVQIRAEIGQNQAHTILKDLHQAGHIERTDKGVYQINNPDHEEEVLT